MMHVLPWRLVAGEKEHLVVFSAKQQVAGKDEVPIRLKNCIYNHLNHR